MSDSNMNKTMVSRDEDTDDHVEITAESLPLEPVAWVLFIHLINEDGRTEATAFGSFSVSRL